MGLPVLIRHELKDFGEFVMQGTDDGDGFHGFDCRYLHLLLNIIYIV